MHDVNTIAKWSKAVKERANNKCVICGDNTRLESHHIMPRSKYPEYSLDIENGLCLCHRCHLYYHNGKYDNTSDKWEGMNDPDFDVYEMVKDYRNRCVFLTLPYGTIDRIIAIGENPEEYIIKAVSKELESIRKDKGPNA